MDLKVFLTIYHFPTFDIQVLYKASLWHRLQKMARAVLPHAMHNQSKQIQNKSV